MKTILSAASAILLCATSAIAADYPAAAPAATWTGFYAGIHGGYAWSSMTSEDLATADVDADGGFGGFQIGYDHHFANDVVAGVLADVSFADLEASRFTAVDMGPLPDLTTLSQSEISAFGSVRGRVGVSFGRFLPYVSGGLAWARHTLDYDQTYPFGFFTDLDQSKIHLGFAVGAGVEALVSDHWSVKAEYLFSKFADKTYSGESLTIPFDADVDLELHTVKVGLNYRF